jgi:hypothetical protein
MIGAPDEPVFADVSCPACQIGVPDWRFCGRGSGGLILDGALRAEPIRIPTIPGDYNWEAREETVTLQADGSGLVEGKVTWQGQPEVEMRRRWSHLPEAARAVNFLLRIGGGLEDSSVTCTDPEDLGENFSATYRYRQGNLARIEGPVLTVGAPPGLERELGIHLEEARQNPIWYPFARTVLLERTYALPGAFDAGELPGTMVLTGPFLRFEGAWTQSDDRSGLLFRGKLRVRDTLIDVEDASRVRTFLADLREYLGRTVTLERRPGGAGGP